MSNSVRPQRRHPIRLPRPWDSPGKNTGMGCHFLLQCMKVKSEREVVQSCPTLRDPMDYSLLGSSVHGIFQARVLEWGAIALSSSKVCGGLIPLNGLDVTRGGRVGFEDNVVSPCKKTLMRTLQGLQARGSFSSDRGRGCFLVKGCPGQILCTHSFRASSLTLA